MNEVTALRRFVIKRFIITLVLVGLTEFLISTIISHSLIPAVVSTYFPELMNYNVLSVGNLLIFALILAFYGLSLLIGKLLHIGTDAAIGILNGVIRYLNLRGDLPSLSIADSGLSSMTGVDILLLILFVIGIVALIILPVIIGSTIFAGQVTREFRAADAARAAELKENERKRYLMISDIAHDLKTPMTTVSGYARALSDGMVSKDKEQEYLDAITSKTARMNDIIQMLFNYVRLDSDGFGLVREPVDICELTRECAAVAYQDIEEAGMELDVDIPEEKVMVSADKIQMSRVITNLITNAVKHNDKGTHIGITIRTEYDEMKIFIHDSGAPIDNELAANIFEPFVMGDRSRSSAGGSGLGLSIAKKIVELHGWKIKLVQRPEIGRYSLGKEYGKVFIIMIPRG